MDSIKIVLTDNATTPSRQLIKYVPRHIFKTRMYDEYLIDLGGILPHENTFDEYFDRRAKMLGDGTDSLPRYSGSLLFCMERLAKELLDFKMITPLVAM